MDAGWSAGRMKSRENPASNYIDLVRRMSGWSMLFVDFLAEKRRGEARRRINLS